MIVSELIGLLMQMPQDAPVVIEDAFFNEYNDVKKANLVTLIKTQAGFEKVPEDNETVMKQIRKDCPALTVVELE